MHRSAPDPAVGHRARPYPRSGRVPLAGIAARRALFAPAVVAVVAWIAAGCGSPDKNNAPESSVAPQRVAADARTAPKGEAPEELDLSSPARAVAAIEAAFEEGRTADALAIARALHAALYDRSPPGDPARIAATRILIRALLQSGAPVGEAGLLAQQHRAALVSALGEDHAESLLAATVLARVIEMAGDAGAAENLFRHVLDRAIATKGERHLLAGTAATQLQRLYVASGATDRAAEMEALLARRPGVTERGPQNLDFESDDVGAFPDGWSSEPPGHRSRGSLVVVDDTDCRGGVRCALVSGFDGLEQVDELRYRNLVQTFDARPYRGSEIRLRAEVRVGGIPGQDTARLWLRVDREDGTVGLFENMSDRSIGPGAWGSYEIGGRVDDDARTLLIGMMVLGAGSAWLDDVSIEIVEPDDLGSIDPAN